MSKVTLSDISGGYNAPTKINANNALVEAAFENTLSRDGTEPNQMEAALDMNGNPVINVGSPQSPTDAARLIDITGLIELTGAEVPSMTGNEGKVLGTDGDILVWQDIDPDALPIFDEDDPGAVPETGASATLKTLWGDGTWNTPAAKAAYAQTSASNLWDLSQRFKFVSLTYAGSLAIDTSLGNTYKVTLTGNPTITLTNASTGRKLRLFLIQDGTGSRTVSWPTITWAGGDVEPTLSATPGSVTWVDLDYDGSTWFGSYDMATSGAGGSEDPDDYDLAITSGDKYVDVFRRLGSPVSPATWEVLVSPGVVIASDSTATEAIDFSGAFPSGTIINVLNLGFWLGKGGDGDHAALAVDPDQGDRWYTGSVASKNGGNAVKGPATGVTVNITNANGFIWGGGGGGGRGAAASGTDDEEGAVAGGGGGGAGMGRGGNGVIIKTGAGTVLTAAAAGHGKLNLDATSAGGAPATGSESGASGAEGGDGGAGGTYGAAGSAGGTIASSDGIVIAASTGGTAGRAVTSGYAGTINFVSGSSSPNVKGSV